MDICECHTILSLKRSMITFTHEVNGIAQASNVEHSGREKGIVKETSPMDHSPLVLCLWGNEQLTQDSLCAQNGRQAWLCK